MTRNVLSIGALVAALAIGDQAQAHAHLTSSQPAADATVASPNQLELHFNEKMVAKFSGFDLMKADGGKILLKISLGKDGMTLLGAPAQPLAPGVYKVSWHAVTADTHRMEGAYSFTVR